MAKIIDERAKKAYDEARKELMLLHPFFGALVVRLTPVQDNTQKTAYTDGVCIGYNTEFVLGLSSKERRALLAHEVMHCALGHHVRRGLREHKKWNRAADYAINDILNAEGELLPKDALLDSKYSKWSASKIYDDLPDLPPPPPGGSGGSGADPGDSGSFGEVRDYPGDNHEIVEAEWQAASQAAAQIAKRQQGKGSAMLDRIAGVYEDYSKVPWRDVLRRFVQDTTGGDDYSWRRPSRRGIAEGLYLPQHQGESLQGLVVVIDTSGSVDADTLALFENEINTIISQYKNTEIDILYCDARVTRVDLGERYPVEFHPTGGGGTDFRPPFEWLRENNTTPSCLIYFTDLMGTFPEEPAYPTLWALGGPWTDGSEEAPFGTTIKVDDSEVQ
tara:strand:+ start:2442 stop:3608 length:1167 start_codon:yes stop_codon:yes gene_type:complete